MLSDRCPDSGTTGIRTRAARSTNPGRRAGPRFPSRREIAVAALTGAPRQPRVTEPVARKTGARAVSGTRSDMIV